jgi:hypothetical protein
MARLLDFDLSFWECDGIRSEADVAAVVQLLAEHGLVPATGVRAPGRPPAAVADPVGYMASIRTLTPYGKHQAAGGRVGQFETAERWMSGMRRVDEPEGGVILAISRRGVATWDVLVTLDSQSFAGSGLTLEEFVPSWAAFLERLGNTLFARLQPSMGALTAYDDVPGFEPLVAKRKLIVGWRTWYGPRYVEAFTRDTLLALLDRTDSREPGIRHALAAPPLALLRGDPAAYAPVLSYLRTIHVEPAWPCVPRANERQTEVDDNDASELTQFREDMAELLRLSVVLGDGQRLKIFAPDWAELLDPRLGGPKRTILLESLREAAKRELLDHPDARLRIELGKDAPDEVRHALERLANAHERFSDIVLPSEN